MYKKIISIIFALCMIFCVSVMSANNTANGDIPSASREEFYGNAGSRGGGWGNMGAPPEMQNGEMPQGRGQGGQMPEGNFIPPQNNETGNEEDSSSQTKDDAGNNAELPGDSKEQNQSSGVVPQFGGGMPDGMTGIPGDMINNSQTTEPEQSAGFIGFVKTYSTPITSVILLALAFVFVIFYKRKSY